MNFPKNTCFPKTLFRFVSSFVLLLYVTDCKKPPQIFTSCFLSNATSITCTNNAYVSRKETLVFPRVVECRSEKGIKVLKINDDLTFHLEKSSVMGKQFLLRTYQGHVMQHTYLDGSLLEEDLYHDSRHFASVMLSEEDGLQVEGVLGPKLRIKPSTVQEKSSGTDIPHILYEIGEGTGVHAGLDVDVSEDKTVKIAERQNQGNSTPRIIYPEILIAVDSTFRAQFRTNYTLLKYMIITFNAVNVRYLTVSEPRVRLKFCAFEIFTAATESFLERTGNYVLGTQSLRGLKDYVNNNPSKYQEYDAVYLVTGLDMADYSYYGWNLGLQGYAYIGGICGSQKVGYGEDKVGTFKGVRIFAHEAAHLLGCPHDGTSSGSYSSISCPWNDGYIMSYMEKDSRSMKFSQCCNQMITQLVWSQQGTCLRTRIKRMKTNKEHFTSLLPGNVLTRDKICQMAFPEVQGTRFMPDEYGNENCVAKCFMPATVYGYNTSLPAFLPDNARCTENDGTMCRNGDCVRRKLKYRKYNPY